ncbi:hypothetical protein [Gimesia maris]|uniref:Uncharacterized protein n=1 Tax=Gimesia maris TaxID=122 RepID=A0ABX5YTH0_9PLAN|nr:hypothetical protein [Gimesia maris]EDL56232.1 hypothetical protein PM8797T_19300 [Gimesia maris DSM 8797]QEG18943.1 hypothetical protein GmarT_48380 [Gimesia maris]QGQ28157.1 hypothetical protein F1729_05520 [Gimesia maris]
MRVLMCVLFISLVTTNSCPAASVKKLVITCIDQQEATFDDIFLEIKDDDGKIIEFTNSNQKGMTRQNAVNMRIGNQLTLDSTTRSKLTFTKSLTVKLLEKDLGTNANPDDPLGTVTILPKQTTTEDLAGRIQLRKYKYTIHWETTP